MTVTVTVAVHVPKVEAHVYFTGMQNDATAVRKRKVVTTRSRSRDIYSLVTRFEVV